MAILRGHFAMTLIVEGAGRDELAGDLAQLDVLETFSVTEVAEATANPRSEPTAVVSVHGADHPGILAAVTRVLAAAGVNVCDLQTRLAQDLYVMVMDVAVPPGATGLDAELQAVAAEQDVTITLRPLEPDVL
jgi:glycine cleavage system transcriptional repressor